MLIHNDMAPPATNVRTISQPVSSESALHLIGDRTADASILCDMNGTVLAWNKGAERLFGWKVAEAMGKPAVSLIVPSDHRQAIDHDMEQFFKSGDHPCLNMRMQGIVLHKNRSAFHVEYMVRTVCIEERLYFSVSVWDYSDRFRTRDKKDELQRNKSMLNLSRDAIIVTNPEREILFWNAGAEKMFGYTEQEALGRKTHELLLAQYPENFSDMEKQLLATGHWEGEITYTTRSGIALTALSRWELEPDHDGDSRIMMSNTNINMWKRHLHLPSFMREDGQSFNALFGLHPDGVLAFDMEGHLVAANPAISALTGYSNKELLTMQLGKLIAAEDIGKLRFNFAEALRGTPETHEFTCIKKNQSRFDASVTMLPHVVNNKISGVHVIMRDVSHKKMDERRILYLATHDSLTDLANRNLLNDRMQHAIEQARRAQSHVGVLFMDLNRFKVVNDSLGHDKGDILLCTIAERLKKAVREVDTVARLGGDEFVVLLENVSAPDHVSSVAKNLLKLVRQPVEIDDDMVTVSTSIGGSVFPQDGTDPATLLKNADLAMYEAKRSGSGGGFRLYTPDLNARAVGQLERENSLRRAIDLGELVLHYQPRLDIVKNELVGVEALVRWEHPEKGLILPANFIPLAEEIGVIDVLGEWVLLTACRQLKAWQNAGLLPMKMSVNVSTIQLRSDGIFDAIQSALADTHLDPALLDLEITESSLMQDLDASYEKLMRIRNLGISLSIDDFGTGYSSLSYLKRLPIDTLKIDKSFVRDVPENIDDSAIVSATIAMAHSMNLRVVAEGVTSFEQMRFLDSCHCDEIQGYLLCQPLPSLDTESFFRTSQLRGIHYSWAH